MKSRRGFVSNSSSTSFVVYIPDYVRSVDLVTQVMEEMEVSADDGEISNAIGCVRSNGGSFCQQEGFTLFASMRNVLKPYVIAEFDVGSDRGEFIGADKTLLKKLQAGESK